MNSMCDNTDIYIWVHFIVLIHAFYANKQYGVFTSIYIWEHFKDCVSLSAPISNKHAVEWRPFTYEITYTPWVALLETYFDMDPFWINFTRKFIIFQSRAINSKYLNMNKIKVSDCEKNHQMPTLSKLALDHIQQQQFSL